MEPGPWCSALLLAAASASAFARTPFPCWPPAAADRRGRVSFRARAKAMSSKRPATAVASTADWVSVCRGEDIPRGAKQRYTFEGRLLLISRTRTGKVTVEDVAEDDKYNYSGHIPAASRSSEPLRSWPAREAEGYVKIFVGRGKEGVVRDGEGHDLSPRAIEQFLNVELSSGVSRFNVPEEIQPHLSASIHLHARSKTHYPNNTMELQSVDPDSSASRTQMESTLMPSLSNYVKFLTGPTAAEHWKKGRAVTPDLEHQLDHSNPVDHESSSQSEYKPLPRGFSASRTASNESSLRRIPSSLTIHEGEEAGGTRGREQSAHGVGLRKRAAANASSFRQPSGIEGTGGRELGLARREAEGVENLGASKSKPASRKPLRPITAAVNSPSRREALKKDAADKHIQRLRPVTALKKYDHLREYRDSLSTAAPLKTDPESLAALRDSVTNFQVKFRQSILSGLISQHTKRLAKKKDLIDKWTKQSEGLKLEVEQLAAKELEFKGKLEEVDLQIDELADQARPIEERVLAMEKSIIERGKNRSERLEKEMRQERSKASTIKGKAKEMKASRDKLNLMYSSAAEKRREREMAMSKLKNKTRDKIDEESHLRAAIDKASKFLVEGEEIDVDEHFPQDLAAAIRSIQENSNVPELSPSNEGRARNAEPCAGTEQHDAGEDAVQEQDELKEEEDWRMDPSVWIRRRELAMRATSPRWRNSILQETQKWQEIAPKPLGRKRGQDGEILDDVGSPKKKIKSPCTKTFKEAHSIGAKNFEKSFFAKMKDHCLQDWSQDFSDRLLQPNRRDHRTNWFEKGLPCDETADYVRLKEIRKDRQHPSPAEDLQRFRRAMKGKWKNLDKMFKEIDHSGDGNIDVHEFSLCCKRLKLGWSEFQVHRVFRNAAGNDMQLDFVEFYNTFAPPRPTSEVKMLFHNKIPFLILEPEGAVDEVLSALVKVLPEPRAGDFIYKCACDVQEHMYFVLDGQVRLTEANGTEMKVVGPGGCFGELAVLHADLGKKGLLRRDSAQAVTNCTVYTLDKSELEHIYPRYPSMREKLYKLSPIFECEARAEARGLVPHYPDCRLEVNMYLSGKNQRKVAVEPNNLVGTKLKDHEHLRTTIYDKRNGWPALELESSVNEHVPDATGIWQEKGSVERTTRLNPIYEKGVEQKKTFDDQPSIPERLEKIYTTYSSKFFRLKSLRNEGLSLVDSIR